MISMTHCDFLMADPAEQSVKVAMACKHITLIYGENYG